MGAMEIIYPVNISLNVDREGNAVIDETETCDSCNKVTSKAGGILDIQAAIWICAECRHK